MTGSGALSEPQPRATAMRGDRADVRRRRLLLIRRAVQLEGARRIVRQPRDGLVVAEVWRQLEHLE